MAPADVGLGVFQLLLVGLLLAEFVLVKAGAQHLPGFVAVAVLRAVVLALHDDAGRRVRQAHRRVGLVDVLAAGARGAVGVGAQVGRVDVDLDRVVHLRIDEDTGERSVAARVRVERGALADQAVDAGFGTQMAVGAWSPASRTVALLMPATSPSDSFQHFNAEALALAVERTYMRKSIEAQSCASVPPAPAWIS